MNAHIHPASVTSLPLILRNVVVAPAEPEAPSPLAMWCASIGRTAADVAALLFKMPMPDPVRHIFEDEIRQTIAAELLTRQVDEDERRHMEDVAWIAFDHRMERHQQTGGGGSA